MTAGLWSSADLSAHGADNSSAQPHWIRRLPSWGHVSHQRQADHRKSSAALTSEPEAAQLFTAEDFSHPRYWGDDNACDN